MHCSMFSRLDQSDTSSFQQVFDNSAPSICAEHCGTLTGPSSEFHLCAFSVRALRNRVNAVTKAMTGPVVLRCALQKSISVLSERKTPTEPTKSFLLDGTGLTFGSFEGLRCQDDNRWPTALPGPC